MSNWKYIDKEVKLIFSYHKFIGHPDDNYGTNIEDKHFELQDQEGNVLAEGESLADIIATDIEVE